MNKVSSFNKFPKNKIEDTSKLSSDQKELRKDNVVSEGEVKTCSVCFHQLSIVEFYFKDKAKQRFDNTCKDCRIREKNILEVGKYRFSKEILKKGFRKCCVCKVIKPLQKYYKNKTQHKGISNNCSDCARRLHKEFYQDQKDNLGDSYVKEYGKRKHNIKVFNNEIIKSLKEEIIYSRSQKYFLDGIGFIKKTDLGNYIEKKYGIKKATVLYRLLRGSNEVECTLSNYQFRSIKRTFGKIKVLDTITKEIFMFENAQDKELKKMFGASTITRGIKTGKPTKITSLSKYKNPCVITRI